MYLSNFNRSWYYGLDGGISFIECHNGFHQGDVLASWGYCMTVHPLLEFLQHHLSAKFPNEKFVIHYYVDDGNFIGPHHVLLEIIDILKKEDVFHTFGFKLNQKKGFILMGRAELLPGILHDP